MNSTVCPRHPKHATRFFCDGCGERLCEECVEEGHRLLFCRLCGERALPLAAGGPTTTRALTGERKRFAAYSWSDAFGYVFRGSGAYVFWSFPAVVAVLSILGLIPILGILTGCIQLLFGLVVLVLLPGALFAVVRDTERGEIELPEWPDFSQFGARINEIFEFILIGLVAAIPGAVMLRALGCGNLATLSVDCGLVIALSWVVATLIWIPAFGAVAVYRNFWLTFRLDLHVRAIRAASGDFALVMGLSMMLILVGQTLALVLLGVMPLASIAVSAIVGLYSWFTIAHLVGLWFRRHGRVLDPIYRG